MSTFTLHLQSGTQYERFADTVSFIAADASGSFGILAGSARLLACLGPGLARFRMADGVWRFLALSGAVVHFRDNQLFVNARRYLHDPDYRRVSEAWGKEVESDEKRLRSLTGSLARLEDEMLKRLTWLQHSGVGA